MLQLEHKVGAAFQRLLPAYADLKLGVAISGGPDSVALLRALVTLAPAHRLHLTALHVNHRLRPEAGQEQDVVARLCRQWQIPLRIKELTPLQEQKGPKKTGIEAWARNERYDFFHTKKTEHGLDYIATAHTQDDQAETVLFHILRGSARRGLAGIPPVREGWLVRPLLDCSRREIMIYISKRQLPYATDPSNADVRYTRNRIRHRLLPLLEQEFSPQVRRHLASLAKTTREEEVWLEELATNACKRVEEKTDVLSVPKLQAEPRALRQRILRHWVERQTHDLGADHLTRLAELGQGTVQGTIQLPGNVHVVRDGERLVIKPQGQDLGAQDLREIGYTHELQIGQTLGLGESGWSMTVSPAVVWNEGLWSARCSDLWQALFDATSASQGLIVRNYRAGDRVQPLGMRGHKKLHDVFIDVKVRRSLRRGFPVVEVHGEIAWVPGCVRGDVAKVTPATRQVFRIHVNPLPGEQKLW